MHQKCLSSPKRWKITRKGNNYKYVTNGRTSHKRNDSIPLSSVFREQLKIINDKRDLRYLRNRREILVNGKIFKDCKACVGLFDVISIKTLKKHYMIGLTSNNKLIPIEIPNTTNQRLAKVVKKHIIKNNRCNLTTHDGNNYLVSDNTKYKNDDSLLIDMKTNTIIDNYHLITGNRIIIIGKTNPWSTHVITNIEGDHVYFNNNLNKTVKKNVMVIPKDFINEVSK